MSAKESPIHRSSFLVIFTLVYKVLALGLPKALTRTGAAMLACEVLLVSPWSPTRTKGCTVHRGKKK